MAVLHYMVAHAGQVVSREHLFEQFWQNQVVTNDALNRVFSTIRKTLGDTANSPEYIATIRNQGYKLVAPVTLLPDPQIDQHQAMLNKMPAPTNSRIRYFTALVLVLTLCAIVLWPKPNTKPFTLNNDTWQRKTYDKAQNIMPTMAPNGKSIAYIANDADKTGRLQLQLNANTTLSLGNLAHHYSYPVFSNDGQSLIALSEHLGRFELVQFDWHNQKSKVIAQLNKTSQGLSLHPQQTLLAFSQAHPISAKPVIFTLHTQLNNLNVHTDGGLGIADSLPKFSPSGKQLAFVREFAFNEQALFISDLRGKQRKISGNYSRIYSYCWLTPDTLLLGVQDGFVKLKLGGEQQKTGLAQQSAKPHSMFYHQTSKQLLIGYAQHNAQLFSFDLAGDKTGHLLTQSQTLDNEASISHGRQDLAFVSTRSSKTMLWLRRGNTIIPVTSSAADSVFDVDWSPNDKMVAAMSKTNDSYHLILYHLDNANPDNAYPDNAHSDYKKLSKIAVEPSNTPANLVGWKSNNQLLYSVKTEAGWRLFQYDINAKQSKALTDTNIFQARLTPDKRRLIYINSETNDFWLWDFQSAAVLLPNRPTINVRRNWFVDNEYIYYLTQQNDLAQSQLWQLAIYENTHQVVGDFPLMSLKNRPQKMLYRFINSQFSQPSGDIWSIKVDD